MSKPPRHPRVVLPAQHSELRTQNSPTSWSPVADWYDALVGDQGSEYHQQVILPGILRLLAAASPPIKNQKSKIKNESPLTILDLACGQGILCRKLAAPPHSHILTGIDAAAPLIAAAQKRNHSENLPITYLLADATKLLPENSALSTQHLELSTQNSERSTQNPELRTQNSPLRPASFDAITCILAIQNMTPLTPIWQACRTLLKPHGSLILVMMHPCFRIPQHSDWHWNPARNTAPGTAPGAQGRLIYNYLASAKIQIQTHPGHAAHGKPSPATTHFHRPLQAYINTLANAGLLLDHIEEWPSHKTSQPGPKKAALDHARQQIPLFLALRARNPAP